MVLPLYRYCYACSLSYTIITVERKLASIQRITSLTPIKDADAIEKATVLGWEVVVAKKDGFKVGDLCVYCEVDSILPDRQEFEFLRERKFRIKTIKLKGQVSQGICFPMSILRNTDGYREGSDVTETLGIRKYDPQAEFERREIERLASIDKNRMDKFLKRYAWYRNLIFKPTKKPFPAFIKKTDEDRIQLFPNYYEKWGHLPFIVTEKVDGQSATYFIVPNPKRGLFRKKWIFGVCSRNFQLLKPDNSSYWTLAKELNLKEKLIKYCEEWGCGIIVQGEAVGQKIQNNKYGFDTVKLFVFNVAQYYKGEKINYNQYQQILFCEKLGLQAVPRLEYDIKLPTTIPQVVELSKGWSTLAKVPREGIVVRNYENNVSFKVINPDFLLKYQE